MEITLTLPDSTVRKIKALNVLLGGSGDIEQLLSQLVDQAVSSAIMQEMGGGSYQGHVQTFTYLAPTNQDLTGISDGLGDAEPAKKRRKRQPKKEAAHGGLTDKTLEEDMMLDDPDHEAKVDAPTFGEQMEASKSSTEIFEEITGIKTPPLPAESLPPTRRRRPVTGKAKVSAFTGGEESTI